MMRAGLSFVISALLTAGTSGVGAGQQFDEGVVLTLSQQPGVVRTGDAVLVTVRSSDALTTLEGEAFGRPVTFWPGADERQWLGLVGVDIDLAAGKYELGVRGTSAKGVTHARLPLSVERRVVETRRIRVAARFVTPSAEDTARIQMEAARLAMVLGGSQPGRLWRGPFAPPVPGRSTSSFGRLTITNNVPGGRHRGVDFQAAEGTPVRAPNAGVVVLAADLYFTGNTVVVDHGGGAVSLFAHFARPAVSEGMAVSGGDLLGYSGATGRVTGPHLHWAMRLGNATIDPLSLMSAVSGLDAR
jgi:murein DD-endopeptidase MepM/ murein hydrolase activator NlpD